ncbi:hypothetical protein ACLOJK_014070 [Asimina triloba]
MVWVKPDLVCTLSISFDGHWPERHGSAPSCLSGGLSTTKPCWSLIYIWKAGMIPPRGVVGGGPGFGESQPNSPFLKYGFSSHLHKIRPPKPITAVSFFYYMNYSRYSNKHLPTMNGRDASTTVQSNGWDFIMFPAESISTV